MKKSWLHKKKGRQRLLLFCNGWGMDEKPFQPLGSQNYDVLMLYDYRDLHHILDIDPLFVEYKEVVLVGWSMGVWAGQQLFGKYGGRLAGAIAINGTLAPIDDQLGIPRHIFTQTYTDFDEETISRFYKQMCRDKTHLRRFLDNKPQRSLESQRLELGSLLKHAQNSPVDRSIYTRVIVADKDFVMPTQNQLRFWRKKKVHRLDGYHFLFYGWQNWDELFENPRRK